MKRKGYFLLGFVLFAFAPMYGQQQPRLPQGNAPVPTKATDQDAELRRKNQIVSLTAPFMTAINSGNLEEFKKLRNFVERNISVVDSFGREYRNFDELVTKYDEFIKESEKGGNKMGYQVEVRIHDAVADEKLALLRGTATERYTDNTGAVYVCNISWTAGMVNQGTGWRLVRLQSSMNPIDNPFVVETRSKIKVTHLAGGIVLGFILGFVVFGVAIPVLRGKPLPVPAGGKGE